MSFRSHLAWARPIWAGVVVGLGLVALFTAVGWAAFQAQQAHNDVTRVTRIIEGTPGPQGEPGVGITSVTLHTIAPGEEPHARLFHGLLTLWVPSGMPGPRGPQGERGPRGPQGDSGVQGARGRTGPAGKEGPQGERGVQGPAPSNDDLADAIRDFLKSHPLTCTFKAGSSTVLICKLPS